MAVCFLFSMALVACGGSTSTSASSSFPNGFKLSPTITTRLQSGAKPIVRLSFTYPNTIYGQLIAQGIAKASKEFNLDGQEIGPASGSVTEQINELEGIIRLKSADCLIGGVGSTGGQYINIVNRAMDSGIPVFTFNSADVPLSKRIAFYGENIQDGGTLSAETFIGWAQQHGKVPQKILVVSYFPDADWAHIRIATFEQLVQKQFPTVQFLGPFPEGGLTGEENVSAVTALLAAHPDVDFVYSTDQTEFTAKVIASHNLVGKVVTAGYNYDPGVVQAIQAGQAAYSIAQDFPQQAYDAVRACNDLLRHNKWPTNSLNYIPHYAITSANAGQYVGQSG